MSVYRVTMKINYLVEINDENARSDPRQSLQGNTSQAALNRASWVWLRGSQMVKELSRSLGVKRSFAMKKDWEVVRLEDETQWAVLPPA